MFTILTRRFFKSVLKSRNRGLLSRARHCTYKKVKLHKNQQNPHARRCKALSLYRDLKNNFAPLKSRKQGFANAQKKLMNHHLKNHIFMEIRNLHKTLEKM